jgi:hypothetical protein
MKNQPASSAPVTIPLVVLTVRRNGTITVTRDGTVLPPPAHTTWRRSSLPEIIEQASERRTVPVWVEVHESDGTSFTDLFPAQPQPRHHERATSKPRHAAQDPQLAEIRAEGFLPGEDIGIAPITGHIDAGKDGTARALIDPTEHPGVIEVVLVGRVSGTLMVRRLG